MDTADYTHVVRTEGQKLLAAAAGNLDAAVPHVDGWDVSELVGHVGRIWGWVAGVVRTPATTPPVTAPPEVPGRDEVLAWATARLDELVGALEDVVPGTPCWNWGSGDTIDFFPRRMAHETLVHRIDAEAAAGEVGPVDSDVAADGVDEVIHVGMQRSLNPDRVFSYPTGSLHLHRTDGDGEWLIVSDGSSLTVTREHAKGDVAVRGSGPALLAYVWGRGTDGLEIFGDEELARAWGRVAP